MPIKVTTEQFIKQAQKIHGDTYDYSLVDYSGSKTKVIIVCPTHGTFNMTPNNHLSGQGCPLCGIESQVKEQSKQAALEFTQKSNLIHNNRYDYSLVKYKNAHTKVTITCHEHGNFDQSPTSHLSGSGCPHCASEASGFSRTNFKESCDKNNNGLGILYVLECFNDNERFIKIGITSNSVQKRYGNKTLMPYAYRIIDQITGDPEYIYDLETKMHRQHKEHQYLPTIPFAGSSTECFKTYLNRGDMNGQNNSNKSSTSFAGS